MTDTIVSAQTGLAAWLKDNEILAAISIHKFQTTLEVYVTRAQDMDDVPATFQGWPVVTYCV